MANLNLHDKITFDFILNRPVNQPEVPSFTYYTLTYRGSLPQFYAKTLTSKLLAHIIDFCINEASQQAFIHLANPKPLTFFDRYEFIEDKEVWEFKGNVKEMSTEKRYRYFEGKYIRNNEQWVKERVAIFASKSGWNFQDLLYYEDEHFEEISRNLWAEEAQKIKNLRNKSDKTGKDDMNVENDGWKGNNNSDSALKKALHEKGLEAEGLSDKNGGVIEEESKGDDEDFDSLGLKCIKKVKIATGVGRMENLLEDSPDTGLEHDGLEISLKEDSNGEKTKCLSLNTHEYNTSDECDGFPNVTIMVGTWNFDYKNEPIVDKTSECIREGLISKDIVPLRVKGDTHTLSMYGYIDKNITTSEPAKW